MAGLRGLFIFVLFLVQLLYVRANELHTYDFSMNIVEHFFRNANRYNSSVVQNFFDSMDFDELHTLLNNNYLIDMVKSHSDLWEALDDAFVSEDSVQMTKSPQEIINVTASDRREPQNGTLFGLNTTMLMEVLSKSAVDISKAYLALSPNCQVDLVRMLLGIARNRPWAINILDALGKPPSGIQRGNTNFWGDYDQCREVKATAVNQSEVLFTGKYCTAYPGSVKIDNVLGMSNVFKVGICIPNTCSQAKMKNLLSVVFDSIVRRDDIKLTGLVCQQEDLPLDTKAKYIIVLCGIFICLLTIGTCYDVSLSLSKTREKSSEGTHTASNGKLVHNNTEKNPNLSDVIGKTKSSGVNNSESILSKLVLSFSIYTNGRKLLNTKQGPGALSCVNGIRFLSMSWVILGHTVAFSFNFIDNMGYIAVKWVQNISFQAIENALVSVDTFFTLSGLLVSYLLLKEMKKNKGPMKTNWFLYYFHRYWRLTPVYMITLGVYFSLAPYLTSGPLYSQAERVGCRKYWWTNLLYINNLVYDKVEESCMGHSWYLANDMQFYILSPILIVPFFMHWALGLLSTLIFLGSTWGATAYLGYINQWPPSNIGGGEHLEHLDIMFAQYYVVPWCRIGPYIVGVATGYLLYRKELTCKINVFVNLLLWSVFTVLACLVLYGLHDAFNGKPLSQPLSILYLTTHRTVWGACICWVVFACVTGNGGIINSFLSWSAFVPLSRLTYCAYLIHPVVMEVYAGSLRNPVNLTYITCSFLFIGFLVASLALAFVVSVAFESPMMGIEKALLSRTRKKN